MFGRLCHATRGTHILNRGARARRKACGTPPIGMYAGERRQAAGRLVCSPDPLDSAWGPADIDGQTGKYVKKGECPWGTPRKRRPGRQEGGARREAHRAAGRTGSEQISPQDQTPRGGPRSSTRYHFGKPVETLGRKAMGLRIFFGAAQLRRKLCSPGR